MPHQLQGKGVPVEDRQWECVKLSVDGEKEGTSRKRDSVVAQNMTQEVCPSMQVRPFPVKVCAPHCVNVFLVY